MLPAENAITPNKLEYLCKNVKGQTILHLGEPTLMAKRLSARRTHQVGRFKTGEDTPMPSPITTELPWPCGNQLQEQLVDQRQLQRVDTSRIGDLKPFEGLAAVVQLLMMVK